jgi:hypothetical protein
MDESEFRSFWIATGSATAVGGFVVSSSSGVTLLVANPNHAEFWIAVSLIILSVLVGLVGAAAVVAAVTERWLPGRDKMLARAKRIEDTRFILNKFVALGLGYSRNNSVTAAKYFEWSGHQMNFIVEAWGLDQPLHNMVNTSDVSPVESFKSNIQNLADFVRLTRDMPLLKGFDLNAKPRPEWRIYIDGETSDDSPDSSVEGTT